MYKYILFFILIPLHFSSCAGKTVSSEILQSLTDENSSIEIVKINRFDSLLYLSLLDNKLQDTLVSTYPHLLSALGSVAINQANIENNAFFPALSSYFKNDILFKIYTDALSTFRQVNPYETELEQANKLIYKEFNGRSLPKIAMHVSGFKANTLVTQNEISISIDKYLGSNYSIYHNFFENYQRYQMQPKFVTRDILKAWIIDEIPVVASPAKTLLEEIIYEGKILYALSILLPEWRKEDLIGYDSEQYKWCVDNETTVWKSIIEQKHLYNNEYFLNQKYISEAPYTAPISSKSPGRVGCWIGWQIVSSFAINSGKNINEILNTNDAQLILKEARYNPFK